MPQCIPFDEMNTISCTGNARSKVIVIPVPTKEITAEERLRVKRYNKKFLENLELVSACWFSIRMLQVPTVRLEI